MNVKIRNQFIEIKYSVSYGFAQHIACYNFWSFKLKHKSKLSIFSPNQLFTTENFLPFTDEVTVELVHKFIQQLHLLALHFEILGVTKLVVTILFLFIIQYLWKFYLPVHFYGYTSGIISWP